MSRRPGRSPGSAQDGSATLPLWGETDDDTASAAHASRPGERADGHREDLRLHGMSDAIIIDDDTGDPAQRWLAQGFAARLVHWAREAGAPETALEALDKTGYAVSLATSAGHACIELPAIAGESELTGLRAALLASTMVAPAEAPGRCPLVLDVSGRLYLHRTFDYERRIAARLARCGQRALDPAGARRLERLLAELFAGNAGLSRAPDWQKLAAALAVLNDLTVISGGPGTGKTTTVVNLLACLLAIEPDCRIALAAPTGKAAARMQDAIRRRATHLSPEVQARLPAESFTIHRLLGMQPSGQGFRHDRENPLAIDVLVVDEASMLDLALAAKLFDAVPEGARIILLGDKDQLAAVESGAVFSELSGDPTLTTACVARLAALCGIPVGSIAAPAPVVATPLHDSVVWFIRNFRFAADSGIGRLASDVRAGDAAAVLASLRARDEPSVVWIDDAGPVLAPGTLAQLCAGYAPYAEALATFIERRAPGAATVAALVADVEAPLAGDGAGPGAVFDAFDAFRVLCAERESRRGVRAINEAVGRQLRQTMDDCWPSPGRSPWFCGRPVMVLRNDYVLKLYNGDIGIALPDAAGSLRVHFRTPDGSFRAIAPVRLPEHETAFATTVHKAQGAEFDAVVLVLPARASRVLTRELVYTGVTRARQRVVLVTSAEVLETALRNPTVRHSGLIERLREAVP